MDHLNGLIGRYGWQRLLPAVLVMLVVVVAGVGMLALGGAADVPLGMRNVPDPLYGVTIDNIDKLADIRESLSRHTERPTTRIVFDEYMPATYYSNAVNQLQPVSYIMGEVLDSFYVKEYSRQQYRDRMLEYIDAFGDKVDIWEVGNEVNGEWLGNPADVSGKIADAYDIASARGKRTAITLYYNGLDDAHSCYAKSQHLMLRWAQQHIPQHMKDGLDYVLVSYYDDDCPPDYRNSSWGVSTDWEAVFTKVHEMFPNAKIGFGEVGTTVPAAKTEFIDRYYGLELDVPNYIGGYFWWYYYQDAVPSSKQHWATMDRAFERMATIFESQPQPTPTPAPTPTTPGVVFADDFSSYSHSQCLADGATFGRWTVEYGGYGCVKTEVINGNTVLHQAPQASMDAGETHGSMVLGPSFAAPYTLSARLHTERQLRTGSPPNPWEVAWVGWNYTDDNHFYYFAPKPNGWELGKVDTSRKDPSGPACVWPEYDNCKYAGGQRFLATGSTPKYPVGNWYDILVSHDAAHTMTVTVDGQELVTFTDMDNPYSSGRIALYNEDAHVHFDAISVQSLQASKPGDANADNKIDIFDLNLVITHWGRTDRPQGDLNKDGRVDIFDFNLVVSNWGK